jgi:hypothetical protein
MFLCTLKLFSNTYISIEVSFVKCVDLTPLTPLTLFSLPFFPSHSFDFAPFDNAQGRPFDSAPFGRLRTSRAGRGGE